MTENRKERKTRKKTKKKGAVRNIYSGQCATAGSGMSIHGRAFHFILRNHFFVCVCVCVCVCFFFLCVCVCKLYIEDHDALKKPAKSIISNFFNGVSMWNL